MYAIVRYYGYESGKRSELERVLTEVRALHDGQPGYAGSLTIDGSHRLIAVNLWDSEQAAAAGRDAIGPQVQRLLEPLSSGPSELIAAGTVLTSGTGEHHS